MKELERLRELASAAKPATDGKFAGWPNLSERGDYGTIDPCKANFEFIAAANPAVVLALLDVIEAADQWCAAGSPLNRVKAYDEARGRLREVLKNG
jgi:hypothetical protein